jgi:excisionase family DNA binding protein
MAGNEQEVWKNNLRELRKRKGYTQRDIQLAINIGQTTLSAIERGRISGRKHMDEIAKTLRANPREIFPYYDYLTFDEAAKELGVSATLISRRVAEKKLKTYTRGNHKFIKRSDLLNTKIKLRNGPSMRQVIIDTLKETDGLTSTQLLEAFAPFTDEEQKKKIKRNLQTVLSRSKEFVDDKATYPPTWRLSDDAR